MIGNNSFSIKLRTSRVESIRNAAGGNEGSATVFLPTNDSEDFYETY